MSKKTLIKPPMIYTYTYVYLYVYNIYIVYISIIYIYIYIIYIYIRIWWYMNIRITLTILDLDISIIFIGTPEGFDPAAWRSSSCCLAWWNRWNHGTSKEDDHKWNFTSFPMEMMVFTSIKYISIGIPWNFHWNTMKHLETSVFQWNLGKWSISVSGNSAKLMCILHSK